MVEPAAAQGLHQRLGDVLLPDDLGERARPVLAVEGQCHATKPVVGARQAAALRLALVATVVVVVGMTLARVSTRNPLAETLAAGERVIAS